MRCAFVWLALAAAAGVAGAQGKVGDPSDVAAELARTQRALTQNRSEVERLLDVRIRHDLGLPIEKDGTAFQPTGPVTTETLERARRELADQDAVTTTLAARFRELKASVEQLRAEAAAQRQIVAQEGQFVVPAPGSAASTTTGSGNGVARPPGPVAPGPAPVVETAPPRALEATAFHGLDPIRGQIHGSEDHQRVAQSLFKAGQELMDRAAMLRGQGQQAAADELDGRAKERLVRALAELEPLLAAAEPPFAALFYKGRCLELLFRYSERHDGLSVQRSTREFQVREGEVRAPFLEISARDVTKRGERGGTDVLGPWGLAAQTAMEHFRWMNLHSHYKPLVPIDSITWPGEKQP